MSLIIKDCARKPKFYNFLLAAIGLINVTCVAIFLYRALPYWLNFSVWDANAAKFNKIYYFTWLLIFSLFYLYSIILYKKFFSGKRIKVILFILSFLFGLLFIAFWLIKWILLF